MSSRDLRLYKGFKISVSFDGHFHAYREKGELPSAFLESETLKNLLIEIDAFDKNARLNFQSDAIQFNPSDMGMFGSYSHHEELDHYLSRSPEAVKISGLYPNRYNRYDAKLQPGRFSSLDNLLKPTETNQALCLEILSLESRIHDLFLQRSAAISKLERFSSRALLGYSDSRSGEDYDQIIYGR